MSENLGEFIYLILKKYTHRLFPGMTKDFISDARRFYAPYKDLYIPLVEDSKTENLFSGVHRLPFVGDFIKTLSINLLGFN